MKGKSRLMSQAGFSLIELMVVVAIIGILATIAVPNFTRFSNKAKQSEAKVGLGAIYSAQKAFFAEWNRYYGIFADIGFVPEGRANYHLATGSAAGTAPTRLTAAAGAGSGATCFQTTGAGCALPNFNFIGTAVAFPALEAPDADSFLAGAAGTLTTADIWTINQAQALTNATVGL